MPSPEQIYELYAPVDRVGSLVSGLPGREAPQQRLSGENSLTPDQNLPQSSTGKLVLTEENIQRTGAEQPAGSPQMEQVVKRLVAGGQEPDQEEEVLEQPELIEGSDQETLDIDEVNSSPTRFRTEDRRSNQERIEMARSLGLHETVSWAEIFAFQDEQARAALAKELGLPTYPAAKKYGFSEYPSWRNILTAVLGLDATASVEEIVERIREKRTRRDE